MPSSLCRSLAVVTLVGSTLAPAFAASPIGKVQGRVGGGNALSSVEPINGWALDDDGIAAVDITVDGAVAGRHLPWDQPQLGGKVALLEKVSPAPIAATIALEE